MLLNRWLYEQNTFLRGLLIAVAIPFLIGSVADSSNGGTPALGNYTNTAVFTAGSIVVSPSAPPISVVRATATTSASFKGTFTVNPMTGAVRVTNAYPAGNYTVTVRGYDAANMAAATKTFTLAVNPSCGCSGNGFFSPQAPPTLSVGTSPERPLLGDLNADGRKDLVVLALGTTPLTIFLGNGDGTFAGVPIVPGQTTVPFDIDMADINSDGKPDLVVAGDDSVDGTLDIYLGNGNGTFAAPATITIAGSDTLRKIALGDLNNDSLPDIITARGTAPTGMFVLLNQGLGGFSAPQFYATATGASDIVIGNFNGDNYKDVVLPASSSAFILLNNGNGTLAAAQLFNTGSGGMFAGAAADLNGDGKIDLALGGNQTAPMKVMFGNGDGTFSAPVPYVIGQLVHTITATDLDGDGRPDLAVGRNGTTGAPETFLVMLNNGDGSFRFMPPTLPGNRTQGAAAADINGDNRMDMVVVDIVGTTATVLLGNGAGEFNRLPRYLMPGQPVGNIAQYSLAAGDFNGDGKPDIAAANQTGSLTISVFMHAGAESFGPAVNLPFGTATPTAIIAADLNGDGNLDLAGSQAVGTTLSVFFGNGDGTFAPRVDHTVGDKPQALGKGDFNGDGFTDLVTGNVLSHNISILINNGEGTFTITSASLGANAEPRKIETGDFNEDGRQDLIVVDLSNATSVWLGNGDGTFAMSGSLATSQSFSGITGDFNNDHHMDLFAGELVSLHAGVGDGTFMTTVLDNVVVPVTVETADVDGDGNLDILYTQDFTAGDPAGATRLRFGHGDGTFAPSVFFDGAESGGLLVADVNSDGRFDLVSANKAGKSLGIYLRKCAIGFSQTALPNGSLNQSYNQTVNLTGGAAPYFVNVTGLPAGLSYTLSGSSVVISGAPLLGGNFNIRISVTDSTPFAGKEGIERPTAANNAFQVLPLQVLVPTAANVSVSGRVLTNTGSPVAKAMVTLTDESGVTRQVLTGPYGNFKFEGVPAGENYILQVQGKKYSFLPQIVFVSDEITGLDLIAVDEHSTAASRKKRAG